MTQQELKKKITDSAKAVRPWRDGIPWSWVLIEGIVMLALGLFVVLARTQARLTFGVLLSVALAAGGALQLLAAWRAHQAGRDSLPAWIRGAIGAAVGLLMFILILANSISLQTARIVLGLGCLGYGGVGGYMLYLKRSGGLRLTEILSSAIFVVIGILTLAAAMGGVVLANLTTVLSALLMLLGVFLILWAFVLRGQNQAAPVA